MSRPEVDPPLDNLAAFEPHQIVRMSNTTARLSNGRLERSPSVPAIHRAAVRGTRVAKRRCVLPVIAVGPSKEGYRTPMEHYLHLGDIRVAQPDDVLVTVLGSCVAVCLWNAQHRIGGMTHALLPEAPSSRAPIERYVRSSTRALIERFRRTGARSGSTIAGVYGGASMRGARASATSATIGERNVAVALDVLAAALIPVVAQDVEGELGRKIRFDLATGEVSVELLGGPRGVVLEESW